MRKRIIIMILSLSLIIGLSATSVFANDKIGPDPNAPIYVIGIAFDITNPEAGKIPNKGVSAVPSKVSAEISWSRADGAWNDSMPFEGGYEYTLTIHAKTSGNNYIHESALNAGNIKIDFRGAKNEVVSTVYPSSGVVIDSQSINVYYTFFLEEAVVAPKTPFTDIDAGSPYEDAVLWAYENGVTTGTSETTFSPNDPCTRAQAVTFLWRAMGCPEPQSENNTFTDVKANDYFFKSVMWAIEAGITNGTSDTTFSPDQICTGAIVITFLHRANGCPTASEESDLAASFPDIWFSDALAWADTTGLLSGIGDEFSPLDASPRADIVTYLYRNAVK